MIIMIKIMIMSLFIVIKMHIKMLHTEYKCNKGPI